MALKQRTCKSCNKSYMPIKAAQPRCKQCTYDWEIEKKVKRGMAIVNKGKKERKSIAAKKQKADKESIKTKPQWTKDAQIWFNKFIRMRDAGLDCPSCYRTIEAIEGNDGWKPGGAWDCGHYLTRGAYPELRFHEDNAHRQCKSCNAGSGKYTHKSKTVGEIYRVKLIAKIGLDKVEWLEGPHEPAKYTIDDLKEIIATYKAKCKELS